MTHDDFDECNKRLRGMLRRKDPVRCPACSEIRERAEVFCQNCTSRLDVRLVTAYERPYPEGVAFDEAWRQRQRADTAEEQVARLEDELAATVQHEMGMVDAADLQQAEREIERLKDEIKKVKLENERTCKDV